MTLTKRNHSNPCWWVAYWNQDYFEARQRGDKTLLARNQRLYSLNARADKVIDTVVDDVHYDKGVGLARIEPEDLLKFCERHFPDERQRIARYLKKHPNSLLIDFENHLSILDSSDSCPVLQNVIESGELVSEREHAELACFLVLQHMRSHAILLAGLEETETVGLPKFEYLWLLRQVITDRAMLLRLVMPVIHSAWTLYHAEEHSLPLPDTPIIQRPGALMVALSPRLLLEVDFRRGGDEGQWQNVDSIPKEVRAKYQRWCIGNTFKEIVFSERTILESWRQTPEFRERVVRLRDRDSYRQLLREESAREAS